MVSLRVLFILLLFASLTGCQGSPFKKTIPPEKSKVEAIKPYSNGVTLIIIRPYDYGYFNDPIQVIIGTKNKPTPYNTQKNMSYWKTAILPNQSYQVVYADPGSIKVIGNRTTLLGPPGQEITVRGRQGEVIYIIWNTTSRRHSGCSACNTPISGYSSYNVSWMKVKKEEAEPVLPKVEHIATYYLIGGEIFKVKEPAP